MLASAAYSVITIRFVVSASVVVGIYSDWEKISPAPILVIVVLEAVRTPETMV